MAAAGAVIIEGGWLDMTHSDISTLHRAVGFFEGIALSLSSEVQSAVYDYLEVINGILDREESQLTTDKSTDD